MITAEQADFDAQLPQSWRQRLQSELAASYMVKLRAYLLAEKAEGKTIFPPDEEIFSAFNSMDFDKVKVVVLGQDPYHGAGQAHGLCFSVKPGVAVPPSLRNIYKELHADTGCVIPEHGCLRRWAEQGVLLLNSVLSVEEAKAGSHQGIGWERFTDKVVALLNEQAQGLVFILWGNYAQAKGALIDRHKHLVLQSPHPSPLSVRHGFFGNQHFSRSNEYLLAQGESAIDWQLPTVP